jgi:hypothetical protein
VDNPIVLDVIHLGHTSQLVHCGRRETSSIAVHDALIDVANPHVAAKERVLFLHRLQEIEVVLQVSDRSFLPEHDDIRVVDQALGLVPTQKRSEVK